MTSDLARPMVILSMVPEPPQQQSLTSALTGLHAIGVGHEAELQPQHQGQGVKQKPTMMQQQLDDRANPEQAYAVSTTAQQHDAARTDLDNNNRGQKQMQTGQPLQQLPQVAGGQPWPILNRPDESTTTTKHVA